MAVTQTQATECPDAELPASGTPISGSVAVYIGDHPACANSGMLAPIVYSLVDGATGLPLPDRPQLNASANGIEYSTSPDRSLLAVSLARELLVIDLHTWSQLAIVDFPGLPLDPQFWSPDGSKLYLRLGFGSRMRTGPALFDDRRIWQLDTGTMALTRLPDLPFDSMLSPAVDEDGLLYAVGFDRDDLGYLWAAGGAPFLSVVDLDSGTEIHRVPMPDLKLGADEEQVTYEPAGVLDVSAGRYYIAHADSDAVTVVDLRSWEVSTAQATARKQPGVPSRLLNGLASLFVSNAEAKGGGFHTREAALSPDGRLLLVSGIDDTSAGPDDAVDQTSASMPAGLRVIDTATLQVLRSEDDVASFLVSPDGRFVFGTGCEHHFEHEWAPEDCAGLKAIDLDTLDLAAHIEPGRAYGGMALTLDGRYVHAASEGRGRIQMRKEGLDACDDPCIEVVIDVIDTEMLAVAARRQSTIWLHPLGK